MPYALSTKSTYNNDSHPRFTPSALYIPHSTLIFNTVIYAIIQAITATMDSAHSIHGMASTIHRRKSTPKFINGSIYTEANQRCECHINPKSK